MNYTGITNGTTEIGQGHKKIRANYFTRIFFEQAEAILGPWA